MVYISLKSEDTKTLGLKLNLGMDKPDNGVAVATSVQIKKEFGHLITTSVLRAMFTHFLVEHGLS